MGACEHGSMGACDHGHRFLRGALLQAVEAVVDLREDVFEVACHQLGEVVEAGIDLVEARVDLIETRVDLIETRVDLSEARVDLSEARVDLSESVVDLRETYIGSLKTGPHRVFQALEVASQLGVFHG